MYADGRGKDAQSTNEGWWSSSLTTTTTAGIKKETRVPSTKPSSLHTGIEEGEDDDDDYLEQEIKEMNSNTDDDEKDYNDEDDDTVAVAKQEEEEDEEGEEMNITTRNTRKLGPISSSTASTVTTYPDEINTTTTATTTTTSTTTTTRTTTTNKTFLEALSQCESLECLTAAHALPHREPSARFNFPHFLIIGFQKTATTSLYGHLSEHPEVLKPSGKEPEFLSFGCHYIPPEECSPAASLKYINYTLRLSDYVASNGSLSPFEASTHIVRGGDLLAPHLLGVMPWVKIVISLREPISRAASMLIHLKDLNEEGCLMKKKLGECLLTESQINGAPSGARATNYTFPMKQWLETWPAHQIHVIQYEELTEEEEQVAELDRLKTFLGLKPGIPDRPLGVYNARKNKIRPQGWRMRRKQYEKIIELVRPDVEALLDLLEKYGKVKDREAWLGRWESVWEDNLNSCNAQGKCSILLS